MPLNLKILGSNLTPKKKERERQRERKKEKGRERERETIRGEGKAKGKSNWGKVNGMEKKNKRSTSRRY